MTGPDRTAVPAPSPSPIPAVTQRLAASTVLTPGQRRNLVDDVAQIADPRHRRGRRHPLVGVLGVAVAAVLAGAKSLAAIAEWAADARPGNGRAWGAPSSPDRRVQATRRGDVR